MTTTAAKQKSLTTKLAVTGMLTALAIVLQYIEFPVPMLVPPFLKNLIHIPFGSTGGVGELSNFLLGAVFALTAGLIYQRNKTKKTALLACGLGSLAMAVFSFPINYVIVYPVYSNLWFGGNMGLIVDMYKLILPFSDSLEKCLVNFNEPYTLVKAIIVSIITMLIYKPLSRLVTRMDASFTKKKKSN